MISRLHTTNRKRRPSRTQILNTQRRYRIIRKAACAFCDEILRASGDQGSRINVAFVTAGRIRELNHQYLGRDYATDVLSFGYPDETMDGSAFLGEIVIAPEVACRHARRWRIEPERELRKLLVHGILHLLGYDHLSDKGEMNRLQQRLLRRQALVRVPAVMTGRRKP